MRPPPVRAETAESHALSGAPSPAPCCLMVRPKQDHGKEEGDPESEEEEGEELSFDQVPWCEHGAGSRAGGRRGGTAAVRFECLRTPWLLTRRLSCPAACAAGLRQTRR